MEKPKNALSDFFPVKEFAEDHLFELAQSKDFKSLKENISKDVKGLPAGFFELMIKQVSDLLHIEIGAILVKAWSEYEEFLEYRDKEKHPPDETSLVSLVEHTIKSEHVPSLKPVINNISLGEIKFGITLELTLKGAVLKIQDGKIMEASIGGCEGKGTVKYRDFTLLERGSGTLVLPSIDLGEGVPIKGPGEIVRNIVDGVTKVDAEAEKIE